MAFKSAALILGLMQVTTGLPRLTLRDLAVVGDTQPVGSYVRQVRAAAPQDYHRTYEDEGDGEIGYSRKKGGGGKKGYQQFDSYHKKAGDNYEFEKQDSFGHDDGGEDGAYSHQHEQRAKPDRPQRKYREVEYEEPAYERHGGAPEHELIKKRKNDKYKQEHAPGSEEKHFEELKEGASDGNGGVEAHGHDPRDYVLPEKYTWGETEK